MNNLFLNFHEIKLSSLVENTLDQSAMKFTQNLTKNLFKINARS